MAKSVLANPLPHPHCFSFVKNIIFHDLSKPRGVVVRHPTFIKSDTHLDNSFKNGLKTNSLFIATEFIHTFTRHSLVIITYISKSAIQVQQKLLPSYIDKYIYIPGILKVDCTSTNLWHTSNTTHFMNTCTWYELEITTRLVS